MAENSRQGKTRLALWLPFMMGAGILMLLCLIGSRFENRWFIMLFSIVWLNHLLLLLIFPRNISDAHAAVAIGCPALLCRVALLSAGGDGSPVIDRFVAVLFDLGTLTILMGLLHQRRLNLRWSILYAMNPVILYAFSGLGNLDAAFLFFLLGAIYSYGLRKWHLMFLSAGLSISFGWVSAAAIPFLFRRENWKHVWIAVLTVSMAWFFYSHTGMKMMLIAPPQSMEGLPFKGPVQALGETVSGSTAIVTTVSFLLLSISLFFGYRHLHPRRNRLHLNDPVSGCFFAIGTCLLFSKTISFMHLSWVIPFIAIRPSASWTVLCLAGGAYFLKDGTDAWVQPLVWIPFWALLLHDFFLWFRRKKAPVDPSPPETISVVIPVINEADRIESCILAAYQHPAVKEVLVVDGDSTDMTAQKAEQAGAITIQLQPRGRYQGRGGQIYRGIESATRDLVAIVHADTKIDALMVEKMLTLMKQQPMIVGGAVGSVFDANGWRFRILELANDFRMVCLGISFGDQVQFFRRKPVMETGIYPDIPLMEDVEFSIRLHRLGRQAFLFGNARVSTRKWEQKGMGHALTVIRLFGTYMLQRLWKTPDTHAMYLKYYGKRENSD